MTDVDEAVSRLTAWVRDFGALNRAFADDVQALVAEVRRLRAGVVAGLFYKCGCPARTSDKVKLFCDTHLVSLPRESPEAKP